LRVISAGIARIRHGNLAVPVRVRATDGHQELAVEFQKMQEELRRMIEADRARIAEAITALEANSPDLKAALEALKHTCTQYHL
jgi:F0F1-type ATP synthase membrane subunit b/b'